MSVEITQEMVDQSILAMLNSSRKTADQRPTDSLDGLLSLDLGRFAAMRDDAIVVLEAAVPIVHAASLEDAAVMVDRMAYRYWKPVQVSRSDTEAEHDDIRRDTATVIAAAIRAAKGFAP